MGLKEELQNLTRAHHESEAFQKLVTKLYDSVVEACKKRAAAGFKDADVDVQDYSEHEREVVFAARKKLERTLNVEYRLHSLKVSWF